MVKDGTFRQDLYFRISVVKIHLPPLRDRADDIPILAEYFLRELAKAHKKDIRGFSLAYFSALAAYDWPGNVRELQNVVERSVVLTDGTRLGVEDLPPEFNRADWSPEVPHGSFHEALRSFKRELIRSALKLNNGNKLKAARELRISRCYLHRLLNQLNIEQNTEPGDGGTTPADFVPTGRIQ
jgi:DNA-binding NtrC family response regulator